MLQSIRPYLLIILLLFPFLFGKAQNRDTVSKQNFNPIVDSSLVFKNLHSPKKATYMSLILPGLGQAYNHKYWKIPIIYAGFGTISYFFVQNQKGYTKYRDAYISRIDDDAANDDILPQYTTENLRVIKNLYWKDRDLTIIIAAVLYSLNVLDANVDAHFFTYDISDDLTFNIKPSLQPTYGQHSTNTAGLSFSLNF
jgi:hypothetical protein